MGPGAIGLLNLASLDFTMENLSSGWNWIFEEKRWLRITRGPMKSDAKQRAIKEITRKEVLAKIFSVLIAKQSLSSSPDNFLQLCKDFIPLFTRILSLSRILTKVTWNLRADRLEHMNGRYRVLVTYKPFFQQISFFVVCQIVKKLFKFSGGYFGRKRTKSIFLTHEGL